MHNIVCMDVMQSILNHEHDSAYRISWKQALAIFRHICVHYLFLVLDHLLKLLCVLEVFHHDVHVLIILVLFDVLDNIGMVEHRQNLDFVIYELKTSRI